MVILNRYGTNATPGGKVVFMSGDTEGSSTMSGGGCGGTELGLAGAAKVQTVKANLSGRARHVFVADSEVCNLVYQAVDLATCGVSPTRTLP